MKMIKMMVMVLVFALPVFSMTACDVGDKKVETFGEKVDEKIDDAKDAVDQKETIGDKVDDVIDDTKDAAKDIAEDTKEAAKDVANKTQEGLEKACEKMTDKDCK